MFFIDKIVSSDGVLVEFGVISDEKLECSLEECEERSAQVGAPWRYLTR